MRIFGGEVVQIWTGGCGKRAWVPVAVKQDAIKVMVLGSKLSWQKESI